MEYQVWTKDEFGDSYAKTDCGDLEAAKREIDKGIRAGQEPILTQEIPYEVGIKLTEVKVEAIKDKTKSGKGPGAESHGEVRRGNEGATDEVSPGVGDNSADTGPKD